jgi:polyhydroxyalkanoate synthesis regulator phasin
MGNYPLNQEEKKEIMQELVNSAEKIKNDLKNKIHTELENRHTANLNLSQKKIHKLMNNSEQNYQEN